MPNAFGCIIITEFGICPNEFKTRVYGLIHHHIGCIARTVIVDSDCVFNEVIYLSESGGYINVLHDLQVNGRKCSDIRNACVIV